MSRGIYGWKIARGEDDGDSQIAVSLGADFFRTCWKRSPKCPKRFCDKSTKSKVTCMSLIWWLRTLSALTKMCKTHKGISSYLGNMLLWEIPWEYKEQPWQYMIQCSRNICQADSAKEYCQGFLYLDLSVLLAPSSVVDKKIALHSPIIKYLILSASITGY